MDGKQEKKQSSPKRGRTEPRVREQSPPTLPQRTVEEEQSSHAPETEQESLVNEEPREQNSPPRSPTAEDAEVSALQQAIQAVAALEAAAQSVHLKTAARAALATLCRGAMVPQPP